MTKEELCHHIITKNSYLCVGLDSDINKLPRHLLKESDPVFEFNKQIIDATIDYAVAYKPNLAFYESQGAKGWESLAKTMAYLPAEVFTIADAKRGDIGNTSRHYAKAFFEELNFDAITLSPYMGHDAIAPYLEYEDKWAIMLGLTSNKSSEDFEQLMVYDDSDFFNVVPHKLYEMVLKKSLEWQHNDRMMYVVGANKTTEMVTIRKIIPEHFLLVPGIGAQGGNLEEVSRNGMNSSCGLLVNSSRGIIFANSNANFASAAKSKASAIREEMKDYLEKYCK